MLVPEPTVIGYGCLGKHGIPIQLEMLTMDRSDERESKLKWYEIPILPKQPYHGSRITIASGANLYRSFVPKGT